MTKDLKDYRQKELRYYVIANITLLLLLLDFFHISQPENSIQGIELISNFLNLTILSSAIFVFTFIIDSLFGADLKIRLIAKHLPGEKVFTEIKQKNPDKRFTRDTALNVYSAIYNSMPQDKNEKYIYENSEWYKIYHNYRDITKVMISNRDFLLCRDIYFSTISIIVIYLVLTLVFRIIDFDWRYIGYLLIMLILSNYGTRNISKRLVYNVIAYDIANKQMNKGE
jgi:hypothetical protein